MRGAGFGRRRSPATALAVVAVVAALSLLACNETTPSPAATPTSGAIATSTRSAPPSLSPSSSGIASDPGLLPGETPAVVPGPDLGETWTTEPDPAKFITLPGGTQVAPDQFLIMMDPSATQAAAEKVAAWIGGTIGGHIAYIGVWKVLVYSETDPEAFLARLDAMSLQPGVLAATSVALESVQAEPDCAPGLTDKVYSGANSDPYNMIGVKAAWQALYASGLPMGAVHVGFLDTPLTRDPKGTIPWEFGSVTFDGGARTTTTLGQYDGFNHSDGTLGVFAGDGQNGGIVGIDSPLGSRLIVSQDVLGAPAKPGQTSKWTARDGTSYTDLNLMNTVREVEAGATIINGSWGSDKVGPEKAASAAMWKKFFAQMARDHPNVLFVYAAGNNGGEMNGTNHYPGGISSPNVVTVGNVDNDGGRHSTSNIVQPGSDGEVTLGAPGDKAVWGIGADGKLQAAGGGTSSATTMVSATAALIRSIDPKLSATEIKTMIAESADVGDYEVGGKTLRVDLAVREAIDGARAKLEPPLQPLTDEQIAAATKYCSIVLTPSMKQQLTTGASRWEVRGSLPALARPTSLTLVVKGSRNPDWRQPVTGAAASVTWQVLVPKEGTSIVVTRLDNGYWIKRTLRLQTAATPTPTATPSPTLAPSPTYDCTGPAPSFGDPDYLKWWLTCKPVPG